MTIDSSAEPQAVDPEAIVRRAFELYLARGCEDGCDVEDWLAAEAQLLVEETRSTEPASTTKGRSNESAKRGDLS